MEEFEKAMRDLLLTKYVADEKAFRENYMLVLHYTTAVRKGVLTAEAVEKSLSDFLRELDESPVKTFTPLIERCVRFADDLGRIIDEQNTSFQAVQALIASASILSTSTLDVIRIKMGVPPILTVEFELLRLVLLLKQANVQQNLDLFKESLTTFLKKVQTLHSSHNIPLAELKRMVCACEDQALAFNNDEHLKQLLFKTIAYAQAYLRAYVREDFHETE